MNFKPGDRVICVNNEQREDAIQLNETYTINGFYEDIKEYSLKEITGSFYYRRFKLAYIKEFQDKLDQLISD
jgi:hypothetical protein